MDFDFSPDQYALRDEARRFLEQQCPTSHVREFIDDPVGWSRPLWKQMADLGWMALPFPEGAGGLGQSFLDLVLLLGELGRAVAPVPFLSSVAQAGQVVMRHGSDDQRARLLPGIASGARIATVALDQAALSANGVEARKDGSVWRLDGEHRFVVDAPAADLLVVAATTSDGDRWFVTEAGAPVTPKRSFDLTRTMGSVSFDGTEAEALERPGLQPALNVCVAAACAEMLADLEPSRSAAYYAGWAVATDAADADLAVSVAKSFGSEALARVAAEGVQVHGGIAFTWEHDMHLYQKRIKSMEALFGDEACHRERIAKIAGL